MVVTKMLLLDPFGRVGSTVRRRRQALGLTLEALAERAGLSPNYIGTIENERRDPSLSSIERLARALSTSPGELMGGFKGLGPEGIEAGTLVETLPAETRRTLLALLRTLVRTRKG